METSKAIEILKNDIHADMPKAAITAHEHNDALKMAINALEKANKYRWHDLRKDPEDLPKSGDVEIILEPISDDWKAYWGKRKRGYGAYVLIGNEYYWIFRESITYVGENAPSFTEEKYKALRVIAWREIEPFEESEES